MPRLELVIRGVKRQQASLDSKPLLPITPVILHRVQAAWYESTDRDKLILWAAICMCFFGFLRSGEAVVPGDHNFDPSQRLCFGDVAVDSLDNPSFIQLRLKQSKTDPFRKGVSIIIGRPEGCLCPVAAILSYMAV